MIDIDSILEDRLAALEGRPIKKREDKPGMRYFPLTDISREYIIKAWKEANILDENGNFTHLFDE